MDATDSGTEHDLGMHGVLASEARRGPFRRRRLMLACVASSLGWPAASLAQGSEKRLRRVGLLSPYPAQISQTSSLAAVFMSELQRAGYEVGSNLLLDSVYGEGDFGRLPRLAAELVRREPEVILASGNDAIAAARAATQKVPIVMAFSIEPVASGLVDSLARLGGNVTGTTWLSAEIAGKAMELLRQAVPGIKHLAALGNPDTAGTRFYMEAFVAAASRLDMSSVGFPVHTPQEVDAALVAISRSPAQALYVGAEPSTETRVADIAAFALRHKLPTIGLGPRLVEAGGLLYYGPDINETIGRVVSFMDRILRGAHPGDLPIEQPSRFELMVNASTARALGLTLHGSFLMRATRVIE